MHLLAENPMDHGQHIGAGLDQGGQAAVDGLVADCRDRAQHGVMVRLEALRHDHVNGCDTSPVAFLEGIFVCPDDRGCGIARNLVAAVETWAHAQGCSELASDAHLDNLISQAFHQATGFEETDRVVYFRKLL
mgnify:CR=1 FL=1